MHFIQPMHLQDGVISHQHQQVACGETQRVYTLGDFHWVVALLDGGGGDNE